MEVLKYTRKGTEPHKAMPYEQLSFDEKIETLGKLLANICYERQKEIGGNSMSFCVSDIIDVKENVSKGSVIIKWEV